MATKQILEGARSFKAVDPAEHDSPVAERRYWRWPVWPTQPTGRPKDDYLIAIRLRRRPLP